MTLMGQNEAGLQKIDKECVKQQLESTNVSKQFLLLIVFIISTQLNYNILDLCLIIYSTL